MFVWSFTVMKYGLLSVQCCVCIFGAFLAISGCPGLPWGEGSPDLRTGLTIIGLGSRLVVILCLTHSLWLLLLSLVLLVFFKFFFSWCFQKCFLPPFCGFSLPLPLGLSCSDLSTVSFLASTSPRRSRYEPDPVGPGLG